MFEADGLTFAGNPIINTFFTDDNSTEIDIETLQIDLTADFQTGGVRNIINIGGSLATNDVEFGDQNNDFIFNRFENPFNVLAPVNDREPILVGQAVSGDFLASDKINGFFGQWVAECAPRFRTVISARYDDVTFTQGEDFTGTGPEALAILGGAAPTGDDLFAGIRPVKAAA